MRLPGLSGAVRPWGLPPPSCAGGARLVGLAGAAASDSASAASAVRGTEGYNAAMDYTQHGFFRVAAVAPPVEVGNPRANAAALLSACEEQARAGASLIVTPELAVTGYTCEDLFTTDQLLEQAREAVVDIARASGPAALVVGAPWRLADGRLVNAAFVCLRGRVLGAVPKTANPNYEEFYELRWFASGEGVAVQVNDERLGRFEMRRDQIFDLWGFRVGIELCEDLWAPIQPSVQHALAGADIIVNLSASNELVAKADYRRDLVRMQSARLICGYVYAGSGPTESVKDLVFGGHLIAAENGRILGESERFLLDGAQLEVDFDCKKLRHDRARNATFAHSARTGTHATVEADLAWARPMHETLRHYGRHPFVPEDEHEFDARAREILAIQATGLASRMRGTDIGELVIGLSGGLDSTLAFLVCLDALELNGLQLSALHAITMPGPGTSEHTNVSAKELARAAGATIREIPIDAAIEQHLHDIRHDGAHDVTFENAQARERTQVLFDIANDVGGLLVGTGDLSELALGWCTYNGDHMAHYNVNASVPKTLIAYLVRWYARHRAPGALADVLRRVLETPITPELVPSVDGGIGQRTEAILGPYELHDFFLYHLLRTGAGPEKIFALARLAFGADYTSAEIKRWLRVFFQRFYGSQFKRTTLPPGPKVGTVSLSPRGDWRMPDEADPSMALAAIDALP